MGHSENGGFDHVRVAQQRRLDLAGRDFLPSPMDDLLDPTDNEEIPLRVKVAQVAGSKPAVPKCGRGGGGIIVVTPRDGGPRSAISPRLPGGNRRPSLVENRNLGARPDCPTEPSFRRCKGFAAIWVAASVMP